MHCLALAVLWQHVAVASGFVASALEVVVLALTLVALLTSTAYVLVDCLDYVYSRTN